MPMQQSAAVLFALEGSRPYGERVAARLEWPLSPHEERRFEDGEHKTRPLVEVSQRDVFVIHSLHASPADSPSDKLCRLLFFIGALKDAGAARVTAVVPYLCYARKDQRSQSRDPITTKYVARMFEACGTDAVMTFDVHNRAAFENAFRIPTLNIEAMPVFVEHFAGMLHGQKVSVVSPDVGGAKRAERFRRALAARLGEEPTAGFVDKQRAGGVVSGELFVGDARGRAVILYDDLISTGTTLSRAAARCLDAGATCVFAAATHGLFIGEAKAVLDAARFESIVVGDTVRSAAEDAGALPAHVTVLDTSSLVAEAIAICHSGL
jgi:ribose-phosphate pyrophosphokinase